MTENELNLLVQCVKYVMTLDDCNPDVGWGLSKESALDQVLSATNINLTAREKVAVIGVFDTRYPRR